MMSIFLDMIKEDMEIFMEESEITFDHCLVTLEAKFYKDVKIPT